MKSGLKLHIQNTKLMESGTITSQQIEGENVEAMTDFIFLGSKITVDMTLAPRKKSYNQPRQHIKKQRHHFADKSLYSQSYGFSSSHLQMWEKWVKSHSCVQLFATPWIVAYQVSPSMGFSR